MTRLAPVESAIGVSDLGSDIRRHRPDHIGAMTPLDRDLLRLHAAALGHRVGGGWGSCPARPAHSYGATVGPAGRHSRRPVSVVPCPRRGRVARRCAVRSWRWCATRLPAGPRCARRVAPRRRTCVVLGFGSASQARRSPCTVRANGPQRDGHQTVWGRSQVRGAGHVDVVSSRIGSDRRMRSCLPRSSLELRHRPSVWDTIRARFASCRWCRRPRLRAAVGIVPIAGRSLLSSLLQPAYQALTWATSPQVDGPYMAPDARRTCPLKLRDRGGSRLRRICGVESLSARGSSGVTAR